MKSGDRQQIIVIVLLPALLSLALLSFLLRNSMHEWAIERWSKDQANVVAMLKDQIADDLDQAQQMIQLVAQAPEFSGLPEISRVDRRLNGIPEGVEQGKRKLLEGLRRFGGFSVLFVLSPSGDHYMSHPFSVQKRLNKFNLADRPYFNRAQATKQVVISDSFIGSDGAPAIAIDVPVVNAAGDVVLHIGGVLHLTKVNALLASSRIAPFEKAQLVDGHGVVIGDSDNGQNNSEYSMDSSVSFSARFSATEFDGQNGEMRLLKGADRNGTDWTGFQSALKGGWKLNLYRKTESIRVTEAPLIQNTLSLTAAIFIIPSAMALWMAFRLSRRLRRADQKLGDANASLALRVEQRTVELRSLELRHRLLFESSRDAVLLLDQEVITDCNEAALHMFGAKMREDLLGKRPSDFSPEIQHTGELSFQRELTLAENGIQDGHANFEWTHRRIDSGKPFIAEVSLGSIQLENEILVQATLRDVTEKKQTEMELRKLSLAVAQNPNSIVITNTKAEIEYVNDAFVRISGYPREDLIGKNPKILQSGLTPCATYDALWSALNAGECWQGEFINKRKSGELYSELAIFTPIRQSTGAISHFLAIKEDITEKKKSAEELENYRIHLEELVKQRTEQLNSAKVVAEAATVAKSAFLANMSHEIRTPLNAITGLAYLMKRDGVSDMQAERLGKISEAGHLLLGIINDILDISKIEAGKLTLEKIHVDLPCIAANVVSMLHDRAQQKGLSLHLETEALPHSLLGDPTRITQALLNLASNAVKFTCTGKVTLRIFLLTETADYARVRFEVTDTGPGIESTIQAKLFTAFEQADNTTTRKHGGTGLGLVITRNLAELMGGEAGVVSQVGKGSTFWFTSILAIAPHSMLHGESAILPAERTPAVALLAALQQGKRILVVEDDLVNRLVAIEMLSDTGLVVDVAEDGLQAIEMVRSNSYDAILMDMQMPNMNGVQATEAIRSFSGGETVPIIAMTANVLFEDKAACFAAGMNEFLSKPVDPDALFEILFKVLPK